MATKFMKEIYELFLEKDDLKLKHKILEYHPYEVSETMLELTKTERLRLYNILTPSEISYIISFLDEDETLQLFREMIPKYVVSIIQNLEIDDAVDVIKALPVEERAGYLSMMDEEHRLEIKDLIQYQEDTAGSIMTTEYVEIAINDDVSQAMKKLIDQAVDAGSINNLYVINEEDILVGTLSLREMILARKAEKIKDIMNKRIITVNTTLDQEDVANIFKDYDFSSLPVVDNQLRMLGIITIDDIVDVIESEAMEDYSKLAGITNVALDTDTETVLLSVKKRLPWLLILSFLGFLTSTIIAQFEGTLESVPTIALFIPMILGTAGNTGTQALAVTVRGLSDGEFSTKLSIYRHLLRETGTGVLNGLLIGGILFVATYAFLTLSNNIDAFKIAEVVSLSIFASLTVSTLAGALIPIVINTFKIDPAVASGPFVTMINDIIALSVYFTLATILIVNA
ncbi:MAG: magnesium transporter [Candidatus Izemoplasma sp.]